MIIFRILRIIAFGLLAAPHVLLLPFLKASPHFSLEK